MGAEQTFFIGAESIGRGFMLSSKALMEDMSDTAVLHAKLAGQPVDQIDTTHTAWMVVNWRIDILSRPKICDSIRVRTWVSDCTRLTANRHFSVEAMDGTPVARASSVWMAFDLQRKRLMRITPELMDAYGCEPGNEGIPGVTYTDVKDLELPSLLTKQIGVHHSMIDWNGHVHNTAYLGLASSALPEEMSINSFDHLEVVFKKELHAGDTVRTDYSEADGKRYVFIRSQDGEVLHAVVIFY